VVRYCEHVEKDAGAFLEAVDDLGLEGIVVKRAESRYVGGRSRDWLKVKCQRRGDFVVGGYTAPQGSRSHFGPFTWGSTTRGGSSMSPRSGRASTSRASPTWPGVSRRWNDPPRRSQRVRRLDAAIAGSNRVSSRRCATRTGRPTAAFGHAAFLGLREDGRPEDCRRERPPRITPGEPAAPAKSANGQQTAPARAARQMVAITNPRKVFWPAEGYTKADLVAYYEAVAPQLLPYLRDRPLVLTRYPDGITGKSFFQKDAPDFAPDWIRTERIYSEDSQRDIHYFVVDDVESLRYVANMGTIPLHFWGARVGQLDRPDWFNLDLDPKGAPFTDVVAVARMLKKLLDRLELPSHIKTSGATGLHLLVPLGARYSHEEARTFARLLATLGAEAAGGIATIARPIHAPRRQGIYRLRPERPRPHHRGAVLDPAAARRAGVVSAALGRSHAEARPGALHHQDRARRASPRCGIRSSPSSRHPGVDLAEALAPPRARRPFARLGRREHLGELAGQGRTGRAVLVLEVHVGAVGAEEVADGAGPAGESSDK
jgi:bifunctional non-homologous end joining protein LigD